MCSRLLKFYFYLLILVTPFLGCASPSQPISSIRGEEYSLPSDFAVADACFDQYVPYLKGKKVGLIVNQSSVVNGVHLCDTLLSLGVNVVSVFAPEHGFRGVADAGEITSDDVDPKTGLPIVSLYGKNKKPTQSQLADIDILVYDLQDVGVRFFTYISTLHYVMEACAEYHKTLVVLDRPNPNGDYIDGPVLDISCRSFVGMDRIPVVYGLTPGELAAMINGERWLANGLHCDLKVVRMKGYSHSMPYQIDVYPSPNLRTHHAVRLYPSLCFFEATNVSVGRGTDSPFEVVGSPDFLGGNYEFIPVSSFGAKSPLHMNCKCGGFDLRSVVDSSCLSLDLFVTFRQSLGDKFWKDEKFFDLLAGNHTLRQQINDGVPLDSIRTTWQPDLDAFKLLRKKYLLYDRPERVVKPIDWNEAMHCHWVDSVYNSMTDEERIAQLIWVTLDIYPNDGCMKKVRDAVEQFHVGGVLLMQMSLNDMVGVVEDISSRSKYPLLLAVDAENGLAMKVKDVIVYPKNKQLGLVKDMAKLEHLGHLIGQQLVACGLNVNFAPVVDVNTNPKNPIIGVRSFGDDPQIVTDCGRALCRGIQAEGCMAVLKHFPGHGDTDKDSHLSLPAVTHDRARLDSVELAPFRTLVNEGVMGVMSAHLIVPALDSTLTASSMSKRMLTDLLRDQMKFQGLVVSDAMNMQGAIVGAKGKTPEALAILAGNDVAEFCTDVPRAIVSITQLLDSGELSREDFEAKVRRVLATKFWCHLDKPREVYGDPSVITNSIEAEMLLEELKAK